MGKIPKVILLIETSRAFGRGLLYGIARYSRIHGPWTFFKETGGLERSIGQLKDWGADGIIMRNPKKSEELIAMGLPTILVIHQREDRDIFPRIVTDGEAIGQRAAEHLLNRGFQHFAYCGLDDTAWSRQRGESFRQRLEQAGRPMHLYQQPKTPVRRQWKNEQNILAQWLASLPKPVGILTCNDDRGQHVIEACKIAGFQVPYEVAVIGADNDELVCNLSDPPMTSIALNTEKAGYEAAELLDRLMNGETMCRQKIMVSPTHIVTRQSTDILAIEDRDTAEAIRFIRQNARRPIGVEDVVNATTSSRRVLEKRFRNILNRSIYQEIRRTRVDQIITMLVETDLSISQIAQKMGFPGVEHIARYFRQETGTSLLVYRKRFSRTPAQ